MNWENTITRHGTNSGWRLHQTLNEQACDACTRAKQKYDKNRRNLPTNKIKARANASAQARAKTKLANKHKTEYQQLYQEENAKEFKRLGL